MIECIKYKPVNKGSLLGFADFYIEKWGTNIYGCGVYQKNGSRWINFPSREIKDENGEKKYLSVIRFLNKDHHSIFMKQAKEALDKYCEENAMEEKEPLQQEIPF